jgi:hypothetical protein
MIAFKGRQRAGITYHLFRGAINFDGGNAGLDHRFQLLQNLTYQLPRSPHLLKLFFRLADYHKGGNK